MSPRIRLLAEQAGFFPEPNWDHTAWHAAGHNNTFEKFALLIAQECADLCDRFQARDVGMQPVECAGAIRKMFGVLE